MHFEFKAARLDVALGGDLAAEEQPLDVQAEPVTADIGKTVELQRPVWLRRDLQPNALKQVWIDAQIRHATPPAQPRQAAELSCDNEQR